MTENLNWTAYTEPLLNPNINDMDNLKYFFSWLILIFLQIFVFNQIALGEWAYAIVFPISILMLPLQINTSVVFLIGFFTGLIIDLSTWRLGVHAFTSVAILAFRGTWINFITPQLSAVEKEELELPEQDLDWQFTYLGPLFIVYACIYFLLVDFGFSVKSLLSLILTGLYSTFLSLLVFVLIYRNTKR
jgi:hypothetical protein